MNVCLWLKLTSFWTTQPWCSCMFFIFNITFRCRISLFPRLVCESCWTESDVRQNQRIITRSYAQIWKKTLNGRPFQDKQRADIFKSFFFLISSKQVVHIFYNIFSWCRRAQLKEMVMIKNDNLVTIFHQYLKMFLISMGNVISWKMNLNAFSKYGP